MKMLGYAALSGFLLTGCFPGFEDFLVNKQTGTTGAQTSQEKRDQPFQKDKGTVFLADFNSNAVNAVTGDAGQVLNAGYPKSLYGSGLQMNADGSGKSICLFPSTPTLSLSKGSMEALIRSDLPSWGFNHIVDKSWQYGLSEHDGKFAAHFGGGWWYSSVAVPKEKWTYVAVVVDGATLKLYVNGALAESTAYAGGNGSSEYALGIGNASDAGYDIPFKGILDALRLSNCPRTPAEISKVWTGIERKICSK